MTTSKPEVAPGRLGSALRGSTTRPGRIRLMVAIALIAVLGTFTVGTLAVIRANDGLSRVGTGAGPQVVATADLYFALSDMDTQVAAVLLMGNEDDLGIGREAALERYEERRAEVSEAVMQATKLAKDDKLALDTIRSVLDGLGEYERLASNAMVLSDQANRAPGETPTEALELYREAYELMKFDLLPKSYNLTLENGSIVRRTYEGTNQQVTDLRLWLGIGALVLIVTLIIAQVYLGARFRRVLNPALLLATVGTFGVALVGMLLLTNANNELERAKQNGFDQILKMSQTRSISNSMQADESRYLLDPDHADTYEQTYLEKSQTVLYKEAANLDIYRNQVENAVTAFSEGKEETTAFLGFFGDEAERTSEAKKEPLDKALAAYVRFQQTDGEMRALVAADQRRPAIEYRMDESVKAFNAYDDATMKLVEEHDEEFRTAITNGERAIAGWQFVLPISAVVIALLILFGVRPRLAEYR